MLISIKCTSCTCAIVLHLTHFNQQSRMCRGEAALCGLLVTQLLIGSLLRPAVIKCLHKCVYDGVRVEL